jgi:type III secretion protein V
VIEQTIRGGIRHAASGAKLSLEPDASQGVMESFRKAFARVDMTTTRPIVLAQMEVRYFTKRLLSFDYPNVVVLSFQELPADVRVQPVGRVLWAAAALPANARNA